MAKDEQNSRPHRSPVDGTGTSDENTALVAMSLLLNLDEAVALLGYKPIGLRKIVDRSRAKTQGRNVSGPTIRFFQTCKCASIKFRREWIDEFIDQHSVDPGKAVSVSTPGGPGPRGHVTPHAGRGGTWAGP